MAKGISMHIGLNEVDPNHYGGWSGPLSACEYDAQDMDSIAKESGFTTSVLLTNQATRSAVLNGISDAASELSSGDIFLMSYSGHGGQVPDWNNDERDNEDETWCLFDGELIDDELYARWGDFKKGVRILVFSDSCHSGTVTREFLRSMRSAGLSSAGIDIASRGQGGAVYRVMPDEAARRTYRTNRSFYNNIQSELQADAIEKVQASVLLISGCQDNQLSLDGTFNGLFTGTLLNVWRDGLYRGNYRQFQNEILSRMPSTQSPNYFVVGSPDPEFEKQRPFTI